MGPGHSRRDATDDSAIRGARPSSCRARPRDARLLPRRSRNSSDRNGSSVRASGSNSIDTAGSGSSGGRALLDYRTPVPLETTGDRQVVGSACCRTRVDDEIENGQLMLMLTKRFPYQTFDVIATHRVADNAGGDRQSKAGSCGAGAAREDREESIGRAARITIDAIEFGFLPEALRRFERPCSSLQVEIQAACALERTGTDSDSQTLATFRAAPGENQTARSGCHARAKAVRAFTMQVARLVSTLHAGSRRKAALKQTHGGGKRRAARVRSDSRSVKHARSSCRQKDRAPRLWITRGATV